MRLSMRRTRYFVKILVEERLLANDRNITYSIYDFSFSSKKFHAPCTGLEEEIRVLLWNPFYEKHFTGGRKIKLIKAQSIMETKKYRRPKIYR